MEEKNNGEGTKTIPVELGKLEEKKFSFKQDEAYLLLLIYKAGKEGKNSIYPIAGDCDLAMFPHSLWGVVESTLQNLTPRGMQNSISTNDQIHSLDSFLLSSRRQEALKTETQEELKCSDEP